MVKDKRKYWSLVWIPFWTLTVLILVVLYAGITTSLEYVGVPEKNIGMIAFLLGAFAGAFGVIPVLFLMLDWVAGKKGLY